MHRANCFLSAKNHPPPTRHGILSAVASLHDPLGFVALLEKYKNSLRKLKELTIAQCNVPHNLGNIVKIELHHFMDVSNTGYDACSYQRYTDNKVRIHCSLVMAKARVALLLPQPK